MSVETLRLIYNKETDGIVRVSLIRLFYKNIDKILAEKEAQKEAFDFII